MGSLTYNSHVCVARLERLDHFSKIAFPVQIKWDFDLDALFLVQLPQGLLLARVQPDQRLGKQKCNNFVDVATLTNRDPAIAVLPNVVQYLG